MTLMMPVAVLAFAAVFAGAALVMSFFERLPAVAVAFAAMSVATFSGLATFSGSQLWFWGVAVVIALAIQYAVPTSAGLRRYYTTGGALAGAAVGLALGSQSAVIVSGVAGAFLGYEAFALTPAGRRTHVRRVDINDLAATALPAVVNLSIIMLIYAQLLQVQ